MILSYIINYYRLNFIEVFGEIVYLLEIIEFVHMFCHLFVRASVVFGGIFCLIELNRIAHIYVIH